MILEQLSNCWKVSIPLVAIETLDSEALLEKILSEKPLTNSKKEEAGVFEWDIARGIRCRNDKAEEHLIEIIQRLAEKAGGSVEEYLNGEDPEKFLSVLTQKPDEALGTFQLFPADTILLCHLFDRLIEDNVFIIQNIKNLRYPNKQIGRMLALMGVSFQLPPELSSDVMVLEDELPTQEEHKAIIGMVEGESFSQNEKFKKSNEETLNRATNALMGLSAFPAENVVSVAVINGSLDLEILRNKAIKTIEQNDGLSVSRDTRGFNGLGGVKAIKEYLTDLFNSKLPPNGIVFIDEIEKMMAGSDGGDLSGVSSDQLGAMLIWMQELVEKSAILFLGHPGTAKSAVAKAAGTEFDVLTIVWDFGAMQKGIVGESGRTIRMNQKVVDAVTSKRPLIIATSNDIKALKPELIRRFSDGIYMFELPDSEESKTICEIYHNKYLPDKKFTIPKGIENWTGSEIEQLYIKQWKFGWSEEKAKTTIVPSNISAIDKIETLRREAHGKYLSASYPGVYERPKVTEIVQQGKLRI